jgi:glutaredoxin 3
MNKSSERTAMLYRMVLPDHVCPFGVKAKQLLLDHGYDVDDRVLQSREEVEAVKQERDVDTTPLVFLSGERIGGCDDLEAHLGRA